MTRVNFAPASATDDRDSNSIVPITNGESLNQTVLQRPSENIRVRTEATRSYLNDFINSTFINFGFEQFSDNNVTFDGAYSGSGGPPAEGVSASGRIHSTGTLTFQPSIAPSATAFASLTVTNSGPSLTLTSKKYAFQGAEDIQLTMIGDLVSGTHVTLTMTGTQAVSTGTSTQTPQVLRRMEIHFIPGTATLTEVASAIAGDSTANSLVTATVNTPGNAFAVPITNLSGGADAEQHTLAWTEVKAFFDASSSNLLRAGDMLGIYFPTAFDRQRQVVELSTTVDHTMLFNSRLDPEKIPYCIPVFYSVDAAHGYSLKGDRFDALNPGSFGRGGSTGPLLDSHIANISNPHQVTATQVDTQGGSNQIATQINAGTGTINGARIQSAGASVFGATKLSIAPASPSNPIAIGVNEKGANSGTADLDVNGHVPWARFPTESLTALVFSSQMNSGGLGKDLASTSDFPTSTETFIKFDGSSSSLIMPQTFEEVDFDLVANTSVGTGTRTFTYKVYLNAGLYGPGTLVKTGTLNLTASVNFQRFTFTITTTDTSNLLGSDWCTYSFSLTPTNAGITGGTVTIFQMVIKQVHM